MPNAPCGVFAVEAPWSNDPRDRRTMRPIIEALDDMKVLRAEWRQSSTVDDLRHNLKLWVAPARRAYPIGYFSFHGSPGRIYLGRRQYKLTELADDLAGAACGKILYFAGCSIIDQPEPTIRELLRTTKARAVCGYAADVDWIDSAAFDMMALAEMASATRIDRMVDGARRRYPELAKKLGYQAWW